MRAMDGTSSKDDKAWPNELNLKKCPGCTALVIWDDETGDCVHCGADLKRAKHATLDRRPMNLIKGVCLEPPGPSQPSPPAVTGG